ncbi:hypothetical protein [Longimicrobium sp.]|uniref:hypothetical protein n=1 Tax=Longimicrobium sp. TaxID=2029185 RepID=UPI003B3B3E1D
MIYYLAVVAGVYAVFLVARNADRRSRRDCATRLGALYRLRSEFWRLRVWAADAGARGDREAAAGLNVQAAEKLPEINRQTLSLRRDYNEYVAEIGWLPGTPDEELRDMAEAVTVSSLVGYDRWITGKGRTPVESVINPKATIEEDALSARLHGAFGIVVGVAIGFFVYLHTYSGRADGTMGMMIFYMALSAAVLGYVASQVKDSLWHALSRSTRFARWTP